MTTLTTPVIILTARGKSRGRGKKDSAADARPDGLTMRLLEALHGLELREGHRVTYTSLAERLGAALGRPITVAAVQRWFDGTREPKDRESLAALASVLGVDPGWLAYGDPERPEARTEDPPFLGPLPKAPFGEPPDAARRRKRDGR